MVGPLIPPARRGGGKRKVDMRQVVNGLMYVLSTGCQWRAIPKDLPPKSTVYGYFDLWTYDGTLDRIHHALYVKCREAAGREASPTAAVIDSQSVKSAGKRGRCIDPHGYDAGKKIKGKKRHILVDTIGLLLHAIVHPADIQDRDGGILVLRTLFGKFPVSAKAVRRWRLSGTAISRGAEESLALPRDRNRQAFRYSQRLRGLAEAVGRRTNFFLARSVSKIGQGLGEPQSEGARFLAPRLHPPHAQKAL